MQKNTMFTLSSICAMMALSAVASSTKNDGYELSELPPVVKTTQMREEQVLNGTWLFRPDCAAGKIEGYGWGTSQVPGIWNKTNFSFGRIVKSDASWKNIDFDKLFSAKYKREVLIPESWNDKDVVIGLGGVATEAQISLDDKVCGTIKNYGGEIIVPKSFIKHGEKQELGIHVVAACESGTFQTYMNPDYVVTKKFVLENRGLTGDVILRCQPAGAHIDGVFIKTSTRLKRVGIDIDLKGVGKEEPVKVEAVIRDMDGVAVKVFSAQVTVGTKDEQTLSVGWDWPNPRLWDFKTPNLYDLYLKVSGTGINDEYKQRFGFREIRVEGKHFILNEKPIRFRPVNCFDLKYLNGIRQAISNNMDGFLFANFNMLSLFPMPSFKPGTTDYSTAWAEIADEKGMFVIYPTFSFDNAEINEFRDKGALSGEWEKRAVSEWKKIRNHPSIVILKGAAACVFAHADDQNPERIGIKHPYFQDGKWLKNAQPAFACVDIMRKHDTTRILSVHHGAAVGDIYACNTYLNMIPLQEKEEWLSSWAKNGEMPFAAWEFGTPFECTFLRGRYGVLDSMYTEPLLTEYCAEYLGDKAYELESNEYRQGIPERFIAGQKYMATPSLTFYEPCMQEIQSLFIKNIWRSWRTWGMTGGLVPWMQAYGWIRFKYPEGYVKPRPYQPGTKGVYVSAISNYLYYGLTEWKMLKAGQALIESNAPVIAWIAGKQEKFTEKGHNFYGGDLLKKTGVIINDSREEVAVAVKWTVSLGNAIIAEGEKNASISTASKHDFEIIAKLPAVKAKTSGKITLEVFGQGLNLKDTFIFTVFSAVGTPASASSDKRCLVFDPQGSTTTLYRHLGWTLMDWDGKPGAGVLVIGRNALDSGKALPGSLKEYLQAGGRVILFEQSPEWYRDKGFRVSRHAARRIFLVPTQLSCPAINGLTADDMRDWQGAGSLVPPHEYTEINDDKKYWGWHWGNTGTVASAAIEKPHNSAWTPLLESGFDLAYSPLMELRVGKGLLIMCGLDLENRGAAEPVANIIAEKLLVYARDWKFGDTNDGIVYYLGGDTGAKILHGIGVTHEKIDLLPKAPCMVAMGADAEIDEKALTAFIDNGGRAILLFHEKLPFGMAVERKPYSRTVKIPSSSVFSGLSFSDLRLRSNLDVAMIQPENSILACRNIGRGYAVFAQLPPYALNADGKTYFRISRWRLTRALSQILGNMGARFEPDNAFIEKISSPSVMALPLDGAWKYREEALLAIPGQPDPNNKLKDPGNKGDALGWAGTGFDDKSWKEISMPGFFPETKGFTGSYWLRREVMIPEEWKGQDLRLYLGMVADFDVTYFNNIRVGSIGLETKNYWQMERDYLIPAKVVKPGRNLIAVRVFNGYLRACVVPGLRKMSLRLMDKRAGYYHPDYLDGYLLGDDPARYLRW